MKLVYKYALLAIKLAAVGIVPGFIVGMIVGAYGASTYPEGHDNTGYMSEWRY